MALYTKQDLKDSQELYHGCEFISKKTRSIYAWRAALWVRYCKERKMDFMVTEDKLISYLDWLFEIDLVNKINTKKSYVPDILRDHMGSVICLWRIQTGNDPDLTSPKEGMRYQAKWDEILRNYPRRERFQPRPYHPDTRNMDGAMGTPSQMAAQPMYPYSHGGPSGSTFRGLREYEYQQNQTHLGKYQYNNESLSMASGQHSYHQQQQQQQQGQQSYQHQYTRQNKADYHAHESTLHSSRQQQQQQQHQYGLPPPNQYQPSQRHQQYQPQPQPQPQQQEQEQQQQQQQQSSQNQRLPIALIETTELEWQLHWLLSGTWEHSVARFLFAVGMAAWVDATDAVGLRLSEIHFASSTLAPRLPASVLRISMISNTVPTFRQNAGKTGNLSVAVRQQFSIIRSRNPLNCLWNALAMLLFYRWQVSESPPPTFANTEWQSTLVIPPFSRSPNPTSNSRSSIGSSYAGGLSAAAAETGMVSTAERVGLVRDLLPEDRFPVRCVVRSRSLHRARQLGIHEAPGYSPLRDQRMAHGESSWADTTLAAQPDGSAPSDRLVEITATNSGYYEPHHTIQRHKVIPPEALQQTIFPWANDLMNTVPSTAGMDERRNISRFLDFLLDLRIVLLQDVAILRCCEEYLPQDYNMSTTLGHKLFNTPLFLQFCDKMRVEASDEIQLLQQSLEMAMGDEDEYRDYLGGLDATNRSAEPGGTAYDRVMNMPHVSASRKSGNSMMVVGSPGEESFSPTISPSPSKQDTRVSGNHPLPYMDSPRSTDDNMRHPSGGAFTQYSQHAHSMPARATDELSGGYFEPMGANEDSTAPTAVTGEHTLPLAKRRRPESGSGMPFSLAQQSMTSGPEQGVFAQGNSPKSHWQPSSHHLQRLTRSPPNSILRSPALAGARLGPATLPPISQFAQQQQQLAPLSNVNASPMMISSPNISRGMSGQQRSSIGGIGGSHRRDTGDVYMSSGGLRRPSDTVTEGSGSGMGVGRDDFPRSEMEQIGILREENANLRSRLQRLEATVAQKHAEMQSWMTRIEKKVMGGGGLIEGDLSDHSRSQT